MPLHAVNGASSCATASGADEPNRGPMSVAQREARGWIARIAGRIIHETGGEERAATPGK